MREIAMVERLVGRQEFLTVPSFEDQGEGRNPSPPNVA